MRVNAVIVAAGEGSRMGGTVAKPFIPVAGRSLILRTLDHFMQSRTVGNAIVVVAAKERQRCEDLLASDSALAKLRWVTQGGGATRQMSVRRGLELLDSDCKIVVVHDGVRPFASAALIDRCVEEAYEKEAVVVGIPVRNTIKIVAADGWVETTPPRRTLWEVHTPQAFQRSLLMEAHERACRDGVEGTDDAMLVERLGKKVFLLAGERTNIKVTVPEDLLLAEALVREKVVR